MHLGILILRIVLGFVAALLSGFIVYVLSGSALAGDAAFIIAIATFGFILFRRE